MKKWIIEYATIAILAVNATGSIIWPDDAEWVALRLGNDLYFDARNDKTPSSIDLVGTGDTYAAGFWTRINDGYVNGSVMDDALAFRVRLAASGQNKNYTWQVLLETDGDASDIEWMLQLAQSGKPSAHGVELIQTATGGPTMNDIDIGSNSYAWLGDLNLYSRWSAISDSTDYYVDIAVPWTTFTAITGVTELEQLRAVLSTSTTHAGLKGDAPLGTLLTDQISNVLSDNIPEPAVVSLLLSSGIGFLAFRRLFKNDSFHGGAPPA